MSFNYYPPMGYGNPYYPPAMPDNLIQMRQQAQPQIAQPPRANQTQAGSNGVIWVQGEEGAKAYMVAAGNSVLLMDSEGSTFYLKSTDQSGMPMPLRVFDYKERTAPKKEAQEAPADCGVTRREFDALAARVDALTARGGKRTAQAKEEEAHE